MTARIVTLDELATHADRKDCWIAVHGVVMDITPFMNEHPGGPDVVVSAAGRDCTHEFEDVGHTDSARRLGEKYIVGRLTESAPASIPTNMEVHAMKKSSSVSGALIAAAVAAVAAAIYFIVVNKQS